MPSRLNSNPTVSKHFVRTTTCSDALISDSKAPSSQLLVNVELGRKTCRVYGCHVVSYLAGSKHCPERCYKSILNLHYLSLNQTIKTSPRRQSLGHLL